MGQRDLPDTYEWDGKPYGLDNKAALKELDYTTRLVAPQESISDALTKPNTSSRPAITENILVAVLAYKQVRTGNFVVVEEATRPGV
ncbi:MAG: hypothetical protein FWH55_12315 [Oscillospiraceae bacterium]|nr:hypothetical protein [Oscillospiraceae bacterium]